MIVTADDLEAPLKSARGFAPSQRLAGRHRCACSRLRHSRRFSHRGQGSAGFGQTVVQTGPAAATNPFRFSTKYLDRETGLYCYGYRYYAPALGRWVNRDPIGEKGGLGLYVVAKNNLINIFDPDGRAPAVAGPCICAAGTSTGKRQRADRQPGWGTDQRCTGAPNGPFLEACKKHDNCYSTCGNSKSGCDSAFNTDMYQSCESMCSGLSSPFLRDICMQRCLLTSTFYYAAVVVLGDNVAGLFGQSYSQLQNGVCEPCCCH